MRRITQILILAFIAILVIPAFLPDKIEVETEKEFTMPAGIIFEDFNNVNNFSKWEPWTFADTAAVKEFFSPYKGKGAGYKWNSGNEHGFLTISEIVKNEKIRYTLEGYGLGKNTEMNVSFIQIDSINTNVKWSLSSEKLGYFSRYYTYFTADKLKEKMESGLENLEKLLSKEPHSEKQTEELQPGIIATEEFEGLKLITIPNETTLEEDEINTATDESLGLIYSYLKDFIKLDENEIGKAISYFDYIDNASKKAKFHTGYSIDGSVKLREDMEIISLPASKLLICIHKGNFEDMNLTISKMKDYAKENNLKLSNSFWQEFINRPLPNEAQDNSMTKISIPIQD